MKRHRLLVWTSCACALAGCASGDPASAPRLKSGPPAGHALAGAPRPPAVGARAIDPTQIDVVVYRNSEDPDLPENVPVVVSLRGAKPSALFRLGCGASNGILLEGFGFSPNLDLSFATTYDSLQQLKAAVLGPDGGVPMHTLRCPAEPGEMRRQILQVYRVAEEDPKKNLASYYLRLRDDPGSIYAIGCLNFLRALRWTRPDGQDLAQVSVPINGDVHAAWMEQGIEERAIRCSDVTGVALAPRRGLTTQPQDADPSEPAQLFKVRHAFPGIPSPSVLYLISDGNGYAFDCGANQEPIKRAFGFGNKQPSELPTTDERFIRSRPGEQPNLRCKGEKVTVFQTRNQDPPAQYFRFESSQALVRFTCPQTRDFFLAQVVPPAGAPAIRHVPREALPYVLVDPNAPSSATRLLQVGCASLGQSDQQALLAVFQAVFGRDPREDELGRFKARYAELGATPATAADLLTPEMETAAREGDLDGVIERAVARASRKPVAEGRGLHDALRDKVLGKFGRLIGANFTKIKAFVEERSPRLEARMRAHLLRTWGAIPAPGAERRFHRELMENPDDPAAFDALQIEVNRAIRDQGGRQQVKVVLRAVSDGKQRNRARPGLDGGKVFLQELFFFLGDVKQGGDAALKAGIYAWIADRVENAGAAPRRELIDSYERVFSCSRTNNDDRFGPCPDPAGVAWWTAEFYAPRNKGVRYSAESLRQAHEAHLVKCAGAQSGCVQEVHTIVERSCTLSRRGCEDDAAFKDRVARLMREGRVFPSFASVDCYVRTGRERCR